METMVVVLYDDACFPTPPMQHFKSVLKSNGVTIPGEKMCCWRAEGPEGKEGGSTGSSRRPATELKVLTKQKQRAKHLFKELHKLAVYLNAWKTWSPRCQYTLPYLTFQLCCYSRGNCGESKYVNRIHFVMFQVWCTMGQYASFLLSANASLHTR